MSFIFSLLNHGHTLLLDGSAMSQRCKHLFGLVQVCYDFMYAYVGYSLFVCDIYFMQVLHIAERFESGLQEVLHPGMSSCVRGTRR